MFILDVYWKSTENKTKRNIYIYKLYLYSTKLASGGSPGKNVITANKRAE